MGNKVYNFKVENTNPRFDPEVNVTINDNGQAKVQYLRGGDTAKEVVGSEAWAQIGFLTGHGVLGINTDKRFDINEIANKIKPLKLALEVEKNIGLNLATLEKEPQKAPEQPVLAQVQEKAQLVEVKNPEKSQKPEIDSDLKQQALAAVLNSKGETSGKDTFSPDKLKEMQEKFSQIG